MTRELRRSDSPRRGQGSRVAPPVGDDGARSPAMGRDLLALQRAAGNAAVAQLVASRADGPAAGLTVQRQPREPPRDSPRERGPMPSTPSAPSVPSPTTSSPGQPGPNPVDALVARIVPLAAPLVGKKEGNRVWLVIQNQILAKELKTKPPASKGIDKLIPVYTEMYSAATRADLTALTVKQKKELLERLFDSLIPSPNAAGGLSAPVTPEDNEAAAADEEQKKLVSERIVKNVEKGTTWASVRRPVLSRFGAFRDGKQVALDRANAFYQGLTVPELLGVKGRLAHPAMQARLDKATAHLSRLPPQRLEEVRKTMGTPSGFNIRTNRNNELRLSEHSFGFAIDLKAELNPNIGKGHTLKPVLDILGGADLFTGKGGTAAEVETHAFMLTLVSASYKAVMSNPALFTMAARAVVDRHRAMEGLPTLTDADAIALSTHLRGKGLLDSGALLGLCLPKGKATERRKALVATLGRLAQAWREANPAKGKAPPKPSNSPSLGSIAKHGFLNLAPVLIGALAGKDAGGLVWLGWADVRDFMHFQLPSQERESLIEKAAKANVSGSPPSGSGP